MYDFERTLRGDSKRYLLVERRGDNVSMSFVYKPLEFIKYEFEKGEGQVAQQEDNIKTTWKMMKNRKYSSKNTQGTGKGGKKSGATGKKNGAAGAQSEDDDGREISLGKEVGG